ncbi:hypothetical protein LINPERHAP2_LOCUS39813 [Linum perenne]
MMWMVNVAITTQANVNRSRPLFCFHGAGWEHFAREMRLRIGSVILFKLDAVGRFKARVFALNGAEVTNQDTSNQMYFKVIIQNTIDQGRMRLPLKLGNNHFRNQEVPNAVHLQAPNGLVWTVNVNVSRNEDVNSGRPVLTLFGEIWRDFLHQMRLEHLSFSSTSKTQVSKRWCSRNGELKATIHLTIPTSIATDQTGDD